MNKQKFMSVKEMFPSLADESNVRRYLDFIKVNDLKLFTEECLKKANYNITEYENKVAEIAMDFLIRKELLTPDNHQTYVDALLVAAMLHNIYFDETKMVTSLFKAREEFDEIAGKEGIYQYGPLPEQMREMVWDTIEGQLGDCTPMSKTKPSPNSPQDLFATAVYIARQGWRWFFDEETMIDINDIDKV